MKKIISLLSMAALVVMGAMITSCNKMEEAGSGHRVNPDGSITYTTTLHMGASTKTVISEGGAHTFKAGDQIAVIYSNGTNTVKATSAALIGKDVDIFNDNRSARFTVTLTEPFAGSEITYVYPASMVKTDGGISYDAFATQDGTLASLAANLDYCRASGSWNGTGDLPTRTLVNQITIGKFTLESGSTPITSSVTSMTVSDGTNTYAVTPSSLSAIWVAMTPITAGTVTITANTSTVFYTNKNSISGKTLSAGNIYPVNVTMQESNIVDLSKIYANFTAQNGQTLTGTLGANVMISIADGATVTLNNATINGTDNSDYWWSGLNCVGDATIILADGSENTVRGFDNHKAGIFFPKEKTLTIQGSTGRLNVSSNGRAAGIGGSYGYDCGNISIEGGIITATGGTEAPGIGASSGCGTITITGGSITSTGGTEAPGIGARNCGKITITGGTVTATGGQYGAGIGCKKDGITDGIEIGGAANVTATGGEKAAGIGSAYCVGRNGTCGNISIGGTATVTATGGSKAAGIGSGYGFDSKSISSCGTITIANTVTSVTATKGADATNSIGKGEGSYSTCGTVTIGGVVGAITESPYTYPAPYNANTTPLTFEAKADGFTVTLTSNLDPLPSLEYSIDGGAWTSYACNAATPAINEGHTISFRGNNTGFFCYDGTVHTSNISCTADCYLYGNIMSLLSASSYANATSVGDHALTMLFQDNTHIYSHDTKELSLPATTLANNCYTAMFLGCTALTRAPELPAQTLANDCYGNMFYGCTNLNSVTCLATDISAENCTAYWLGDVAATGTFTAANSSVAWSEGISGIPSGWTTVYAE